MWCRLDLLQTCLVWSLELSPFDETCDALKCKVLLSRLVWFLAILCDTNVMSTWSLANLPCFLPLVLLPYLCDALKCKVLLSRLVWFLAILCDTNVMSTWSLANLPCFLPLVLLPYLCDALKCKVLLSRLVWSFATLCDTNVMSTWSLANLPCFYLLYCRLMMRHAMRTNAMSCLVALFDFLQPCEKNVEKSSYTIHENFPLAKIWRGSFFYTALLRCTKKSINRPHMKNVDKKAHPNYAQCCWQVHSTWSRQQLRPSWDLALLL